MNIERLTTIYIIYSQGVALRYYVQPIQCETQK